MQKLATLLLLLALATSLAAQENRVIRDFIQEHRRGEENIAFKVPGWLVGLASEIGMVATQDEEERVVFELLSELGTVRMVTFLNEDFPKPGSSVTNLLYSLERYHRFERWAEVRSREGDRITLSVLYDGKKIRNLIAVITDSDEDRTVFLSARAHLSPAELGRIVNRLNEI